jgi:glucosamine--fructose-6-phosphate aminotransferase (isomerizing)
VGELTGAYAIAVVSEQAPGKLIVARKGAPLLLGLGKNENFAASDASALLQVTRRIVYLEEGDVVELSIGGYRILDPAGVNVERAVHESKLSADAVELGPYRHYMQKMLSSLAQSPPHSKW